MTKLNRIERLAMNNPLRHGLMQRIEWPIFKRLMKKTNLNAKGAAILDLGCGSGQSCRLLWGLEPLKIIAFDLMESQIALAKAKDQKTRYFIGNIEQLGLSDQSFDLAFGFGILHHVENWKEALSEISRVLKPGAHLVIEEPSGSSAAFFRGLFRFNIPRQGAFTLDEMIEEANKLGLTLKARSFVLLPCFGAFVFERAG